MSDTLLIPEESPSKRQTLQVVQLAMAALGRPDGQERGLGVGDAVLEPDPDVVTGEGGDLVLREGIERIEVHHHLQPVADIGGGQGALAGGMVSAQYLRGAPGGGNENLYLPSPAAPRR